MKIESRINGRVVVFSGSAMLLAGENRWDISLEDLTYSFTIEPSDGNPRAEHIRTLGKHADLKIVGGAGSSEIAIHLPAIAFLANVAHNLTFAIRTIGDLPNAIRIISYTVTRG